MLGTMAARLVVYGILLVLGAPVGSADDVSSDVYLTTPELITKYGYPVETHTVETEDGYLLSLHRIPHGKDWNSSATSNKHAVLVQHGLLCSSADWIVMGPEQGLGYLLADAGYDVWLGNARGNTYSRNHRDNLSAKQYWDFSWHEMGVYDLPAVIDHILEKNGQDKLFYVGHSMGTTMFYVMASEKPEYNDKVRAMFSLAPVAYLGHMRSAMTRLLSRFGDVTSWVTNMMGINEFLPSNQLMTLLGRTFCRDHAISQTICSNVLFLIAGFDSVELNMTMLPVILGHTPAGASIKELLHYGQSTKSGRFAKYDYGWWDNSYKYGSITSPEYNISQITAPVALLYSQNDMMASTEDVNQLGNELPNLIEKYQITFSAFNHVDFMWAIHAKSLVYDEVLNIMSKF